MEEPQGTIPLTNIEKSPWWCGDDKGKEQVEDDDNSDQDHDAEKEAGSYSDSIVVL